MENRENQNPSTGSEPDISKSQSQQQQPSTSQDRQPQSDAEQSGDQAATGQAQSGQFNQSSTGQFDQSSTGQSGQAGSAQSGFGETATQDRSDVEGSSIGQEPTGESESGFVGSQGGTDTSSELVDEDEDQQFRKDGQGAPEGK